MVLEAATVIMLFEAYNRICVGLPLESTATTALVKGFHESLGLEPQAKLSDIHDKLRFEAKRHEVNIADRVRYELAFEAYVDQLWDVDCAIGGHTEGGVEPGHGWVFVGVRVEQMQEIISDEMPALASRPRWLKKGDLTIGSDYAKTMSPETVKPFLHACKAYQRASKMIIGDATVRLKNLPVVRQREPDWALVRWLVETRLLPEKKK